MIQHVSVRASTKELINVDLLPGDNGSGIVSSSASAIADALPVPTQSMLVLPKIGAAPMLPCAARLQIVGSGRTPTRGYIYY